jgi:hypothetical protein
LFTLSGNYRTDLWQVAVTTWEKAPILGVGAGSYGRYWEKDPRWSLTAQDAHSLYLETLAEIGPLGLFLLTAMLTVPVAALVAARRKRIIAAALGAYMAYLAHAAIDWDWELPGITLTAILVGSLGLIALRRRSPARLNVRLRLTGALAVVAVAFFALVGYIGNDALARAQLALDQNNPQAAISESGVASRWAPWSPYPLTVKGEALLRMNDVEAAHSAFLQATNRDSGYWRAWLGLAVASRGEERAVALRKAISLYPRSIEIIQTERLLASEGNRASPG